MEKISRDVNTPEIEAKKIFSKVIDYEYKLINYYLEKNINLPVGVTQKKYFEELYKEYVKLFLDKAKRVERRNNK